jgi:hypothetical protein
VVVVVVDCGGGGGGGDDTTPAVAAVCFFSTKSTFEFDVEEEDDDDDDDNDDDDEARTKGRLLLPVATFLRVVRLPSADTDDVALLTFEMESDESTRALTRLGVVVVVSVVVVVVVVLVVFLMQLVDLRLVRPLFTLATGRAWLSRLILLKSTPICLTLKSYTFTVHSFKFFCSS